MVQPANQIELRSKVKPRDPATQPFRVVLHQTASDEWVTHLENVTEIANVPELLQQNVSPCKKFCSKKSPDYYWGHYHGHNYAEALNDYRLRKTRYDIQ